MPKANTLAYTTLPTSVKTFIASITGGAMTLSTMTFSIIVKKCDT
jgi:hypothetical protein